jgi:hypothetical protein
MASKFAGLEVSGAPARMMVIHPATGEILVRNDTNAECWIEAYPAQSKRGTEIDREIRIKAMRSRGGVGVVTPRMIEEQQIVKLGQLTTAWNLALLDGTPIDVPYTEEDAIELYGLPNAAWLRDQLFVFVQNLGNFQPTPSGTS